MSARSFLQVSYGLNESFHSWCRHEHFKIRFEAFPMFRQWPNIFWVHKKVYKFGCCSIATLNIDASFLHISALWAENSISKSYNFIDLQTRVFCLFGHSKSLEQIALKAENKEKWGENWEVAKQLIPSKQNIIWSVVVQISSRLSSILFVAPHCQFFQTEKAPKFWLGRGWRFEFLR